MLTVSGRKASGPVIEINDCRDSGTRLVGRFRSTSRSDRKKISQRDTSVQVRFFFLQLLRHPLRFHFT